MLDAKTVIVTGGARGIGEAQVRLLAKEGASVAIADIRDEAGEIVAAQLRAAGCNARYFKLDVTSAAGWQSTVATVETWSGQINGLVNTAGVNLRGPIATTEVENWNTVLAVNVTGPMLGMQTVAPALARAGGGSIVNITSNIAMVASRGAAYTTSKWALRGLSKVAALEFAANNIRVNTVGPGVVPTELNRGQPYLETTASVTPLGRLATADDIAKAVLFLMSDLSTFITGTDIPVDGGFILGKA